MVKISRSWPKIEDLIPHRQPILLIESIEESSSSRTACRGRVSPGSAFQQTEDRVSQLAGIEMAAQTAAVHQALQQRKPPTPRIGYLTLVRDARFAGGAPILVGEVLVASVEVRRETQTLALFSISVVVRQSGRELVVATLGVAQS